MDPFKKALTAALRGEPIDAADLDPDDFALLTKAATLARTVAVLTDELGRVRAEADGYRTELSAREDAIAEARLEGARPRMVLQ